MRLLPLSAPRPRCRVVPPCRSARPAGAGGAPSHGHAKLHVVCSPADGRSGHLQFEVTIDRTATDARAQVCEWARAPGWRWGPQGARVPDRTLARRLPPRPRATPGGAPPVKSPFRGCAVTLRAHSAMTEGSEHLRTRSLGVHTPSLVKSLRTFCTPLFF